MFSGKPDAGNLPVRFEEGRGGSIGLPLSYSPGHLFDLMTLVVRRGGTAALGFRDTSMIEDDARHELSNTTSARSDYSRREFLGLAGAGSALSLVIGSAAGGNAPSPPNSGGKINVPALDQNLKAEFEEYGFVVLKEAIPRRDALNIEERVKEIMSRRPDADKIDQHLPELLNYLDPKDDAAFLPLVTQPVCLALAQALLGEGFQMSEVGCRWRKPGAPAGPMHVSRPIESFNRDGLPLPNVCFVLAYSWMLSDLTADMGATLYLPFSHHSPRGPRPNVKYSYAVPIEAPAGSV